MAWEQLANDITFYAFFVASKLGKTSLTVTVDVFEVTSGGTATQIVTGGSAAAVGGGIYSYRLVASNVDAVGEYVAIFKTSDATVDQKEIPSLWIVGRNGDENLDAAISTRATPAQVNAEADQALADAGVTTTVTGRIDATVSSRNATTPPTAAAIADATWDELIAGHVVATSTGALLSSAGAAADPLLNAVPGTYASGTAGNALGRIASGQLTIVQPVIDDGLIRVKQGDDYYAADGRSFDISFTTWPVLTSATITWTMAGVALTGSVVNANTVRLEMTKVQSASLPRGAGSYAVKATLAGTSHDVTLVEDALLLVT